MYLNIKDPEAHFLAERIAQKTDETITAAVIQALRDRLKRLESAETESADALAADLYAIASRASAHISKPYQDHGSYLYDDKGLPR